MYCCAYNANNYYCSHTLYMHTRVYVHNNTNLKNNVYSVHACIEKESDYIILLYMSMCTYSSLKDVCSVHYKLRKNSVIMIQYLVLAGALVDPLLSNGYYYS